MAHLLVVRHGPAGELKAGQRDADRSLTEDGRARCRETFRGVQARVPRLDAILASPFLRAQQTAELLVEAFPESPQVETWADLTPDGAAACVEAGLLGRWAEAPGAFGLALVTHQPLVSDLVVRLVGRRIAFPPAGWAVLAYERREFRLLESSGDRP